MLMFTVIPVVPVNFRFTAFYPFSSSGSSSPLVSTFSNSSVGEDSKSAISASVLNAHHKRKRALRHAGVAAEKVPECLIIFAVGIRVCVEQNGVAFSQCS